MKDKLRSTSKVTTTRTDFDQVLRVLANRIAIAVQASRKEGDVTDNERGVIFPPQLIIRDALSAKTSLPALSLKSQELPESLNELIRQMRVNGDSLMESKVGFSVAPDAGNTGDGVVVVDVKRSDGLVNEYAYEEDITVTVSSASANGQSSLRVRSNELKTPASKTLDDGARVIVAVKGIP